MRNVDGQPGRDDRQAIEQALAESVRALGAHLLCLAAGADSPADLHAQIQRVADTISAYRDAHGHLPSHDLLRSVLDPHITFQTLRPWIRESHNSPENVAFRLESGEADIESAQEDVVRNALLCAAAMLLNQNTQRIDARNAIDVAIERLTEARKKNRGYWARSGVGPTRQRSKRKKEADSDAAE